MSKTKRKKCDLCGDDHHASECDTEYCHDCGELWGTCGCDESEVELGEEVYEGITMCLANEGPKIDAILKRDGALAAMAAYMKAKPGTFGCWRPYVERWRDRHLST